MIYAHSFSGDSYSSSLAVPGDASSQMAFTRFRFRCRVTPRSQRFAETGVSPHGARSQRQNHACTCKSCTSDTETKRWWLYGSSQLFKPVQPQRHLIGGTLRQSRLRKILPAAEESAQLGRCIRIIVGCPRRGACQLCRSGARLGLMLSNASFDDPFKWFLDPYNKGLGRPRAAPDCERIRVSFRPLRLIRPLGTSNW